MDKKIISLALAAALIFSLSGCAGVFHKEYLHVSDYTDDFGTADKAQTVKNLVQLKAAVINMVENNLSEDTFIFSSYDGDLQSDLSQLGWQIKTENALSGYCVDYISCYLSHIVNYYEAQIRITYKHAAEEIASIIPIAGMDSFKENISRALESCDKSITFRWITGSLTQEDALAAVWEVYCENPSACVVPPDTEVSLYSTGGLVNIVDLSFDYGYSEGTLQSMKAELLDAVSVIVSADYGDNAAAFLQGMCSALSGSCEFSPDSGSTAYDALVGHAANSRGLALALAALCKSANIGCFVVSGTVGSSEHFWNIVGIGNTYCHIDLSSAETPAVFYSDSQMINAGYNWETEKYPACESAG
ncbi:MAG: hypothetical protein EOM14_03475 [Clostridia bacterium]|nr:hypothetical protein [Clostridia bacterium]